MSSRTTVVVPMKPLALAKQRLARVLDPDRRAELALWMLDRVLSAVSACGTGKVVVLGGDRTVAALSRERGADWLPDRFGDLNAALQGFLDDMQGSRPVLVLAADLPMLRPHEAAALLGAGSDESMVLGPGLRGGTNALLLPAAVPFRFHYGEGSFARHAEQAERLGMPWRAFESPGVREDVDLPEDLTRLERALPDLWRQVAAASCHSERSEASVPCRGRVAQRRILRFAQNDSPSGGH